MYQLTRKTGDGVLQVHVDTVDAGGARVFGGSLYFGAAGTPDGTVQTDEAMARTVMADPGHAALFTCTPDLPALPDQPKADPADAQAAQDAGDEGPATKRRTRG